MYLCQSYISLPKDQPDIKAIGSILIAISCRKISPWSCHHAFFRFYLPSLIPLYQSYLSSPKDQPDIKTIGPIFFAKSCRNIQRGHCSTHILHLKMEKQNGPFNTRKLSKKKTSYLLLKLCLF